MGLVVLECFRSIKFTQHVVGFLLPSVGDFFCRFIIGIQSQPQNQKNWLPSQHTRYKSTRTATSEFCDPNNVCYDDEFFVSFRSKSSSLWWPEGGTMGFCLVNERWMDGNLTCYLTSSGYYYFIVAKKIAEMSVLSTTSQLVIKLGFINNSFCFISSDIINFFRHLSLWMKINSGDSLKKKGLSTRFPIANNWGSICKLFVSFVTHLIEQ